MPIVTVDPPGPGIDTDTGPVVTVNAVDHAFIVPSAAASRTVVKTGAAARLTYDGAKASVPAVASGRSASSAPAVKPHDANPSTVPVVVVVNVASTFTHGAGSAKVPPA